jgi:hypothetical protein
MRCGRTTALMMLERSCGRLEGRRSSGVERSEDRIEGQAEEETGCEDEVGRRGSAFPPHREAV